MEHAATHEATNRKREATLYVVATPIGNLRDISLRALDVLTGVDAIAAEDTRITRRLLDHYGIAKRLIAVHEHNERRSVKQVLALLGAGRSLALVCDAGTPAISDPGAVLVSAVREAGYTVTPVPGANAAIAALAAAGFDTPHFLFFGFPPAKSSARRRALAALAALPYTLVFYEAPHRIAECLQDMNTVLGAVRRVVIVRELTKVFESIHVCALAQAEHWIEADTNRSRGEFVLIVEGAEAPAEDPDQGRRTLEVLLAELPLKQAVDLAAKLTGGRKNELYQLALALKKRES
ncbi:MAG: 16S rRNA (cytidine(1402)-2'-O)-methyltransferase [Betaproteobacteria bacterium]|nr:16S rRNA (cytidine(1402)-2'-O)-methyltransferase [Betaproteobacteria bacterium]MDH3437623.1 16S rRNA (cytidine(1402)-2'-O)-methyltransferase [Betaproteobacteria bacterium]